MNKNLLVGLTFSSIFLLTSCGGSAPAPWSRPDDSPWKEKRDAESRAAPADEVIYQPVAEPAAPEPVTYEPVAAEPMPAPEPVASTSKLEAYHSKDTSGGMPAPESVEAETMVVTAAAEDVVLAMPADSYAVQVYASKTEDSINRFQQNKGLEDLKIVKTDRNGEIVYVLVGLYDNRAAAVDAATDLERKIGSQPWVRSMPGLQKIIAK